MHQLCNWKAAATFYPGMSWIGFRSWPLSVLVLNCDGTGFQTIYMSCHRWEARNVSSCARQSDPHRTAIPHRLARWRRRLHSLPQPPAYPLVRLAEEGADPSDACRSSLMHRRCRLGENAWAAISPRFAPHLADPRSRQRERLVEGGDVQKGKINGLHG
jgi:hypothetical protein